MNIVLGEETVHEVALVSPTAGRSPRKHASSSKYDVFANCEVAEDQPSDCEDEIQDGSELGASGKGTLDSKTTPMQNVLSVSLSRVDIKMLFSTSTVGSDSSTLLCYEDVIMQISQEKEVPLNQHPQHQIFKKCAMINNSSQPQPGDSAVSCRLQFKNVE